MENPIATIILGFIGVLLSLIFRYVPKAKVWFDTKLGDNKGLFMLGLCLIVAIIYFAFGCIPLLASWLNINVGCSPQGALKMVEAFVVILLSNQITYLTTKG